ncbi:MAG: hypothetical protein AAFV80_08120 [Bacteroidota bacterium]
MRPQITLLVWCLLPFFAFAQTKQSTHIHFQSESLELTQEGKAELEHFTQKLHSSAEKQLVVIECYPGYSLDFREERAHYLAEILQKGAIKVERIVYHYSVEQFQEDFGELAYRDFCTFRLQPDLSNHEAIENAEMGVTPAEQKPASILSFPFVENEIQNSDTVILELPEGSILTIPSFAFAYADGTEYEGDVVIKSKEVLNLATAFFDDMTTDSPEGYLESRGMIIVEAETPRGEELILRPERSINVKIPTDLQKQDADFELYSNTKRSGIGKWLITEDDVEITRITRANFKWTAISEAERMAMEQEKEAKIRDWKAKRVKKSTIRKRLKRYENYCKRRYPKKKVRVYTTSNGEKRKAVTKPGTSKWSTRDLDKTTRSMIMGGAKYKWERVEDEDAQLMAQFYSFNMRTLGPYNIDRLLKMKFSNERKDIIVENTDNLQLRMFMDNYFVLISGFKVDKQIKFLNVPTDEQVTILASEKLENGQVRFGYVKCMGPNQPIRIDNVKTMDTIEFEETVYALTGR